MGLATPLSRFGCAEWRQEGCPVPVGTARFGEGVFRNDDVVKEYGTRKRIGGGAQSQFGGYNAELGGIELEREEKDVGRERAMEVTR